MAELYLHQRQVQSVFNLLGEKENDITFSLGWALSRSPRFLCRFLGCLPYRSLLRQVPFYCAKRQPVLVPRNCRY